MKDLLRLSNDELQELTGPQSLRLCVAIGIAAASGFVSLLGAVSFFTDSTSQFVPLPGVNQVTGKVIWAFVLIGLLVTVPVLVRGVVKKRLQGAIALSLLIHLLLCLSAATMRFRLTPEAPAENTGELGELPEEITLPDYAGSDSSDAQPIWRQPVMTETPENSKELSRTESETPEGEKQESQTPEQSPTIDAAELSRRQLQLELADDASEEIERRSRDQELPDSTEIEQPEVSTAEAAQPKFDTEIDREKQETNLSALEPERVEMARSAPRFDAVRPESQRSEVLPESDRVQIDPAARMAGDLEAAVVTEETSVQTNDSTELAFADPTVQLNRQQSRVAAEAMNQPRQLPASAAQKQPELSSIRPERSIPLRSPANAAPASGGSTQLSRSNSVAARAAASSAESIPVEAAESAGSVDLMESESIAETARGRAASLPAAADAAAVSAPAGTSASGTPAFNRPAGRVTARRSSDTGSQPAIRGSGSASGLSGRSNSTEISAVGTAPESVEVARAEGTVGRNSAAMVNGPSATSSGTSVARRNTAIPGSQGTGIATGSANSPSGASAQGSPLRAATGSAAGARRPEASARLEPSDSDGTGRARTSMARATAVAGLSPEAAEEEQSGTLVFAGPQATASVGSRVTGPRISSLPRRSAGLPGGSNPEPSATSGNAGAVSGISQAAAITPRFRSAGEAPALATAETITGLIRRFAPEIQADARLRISDSLSMRKAEARKDAAKTLGGSQASEEAVERGLEWLTRNQYPDGHWSINKAPGDDRSSDPDVSFQSDSAATGLGLLAFLGAGYTHQSGRHEETVQRAVQWLLSRQKPNGDLFADETEFVWFYSHGIASIAVCEAFGMTKDARLQQPAQKALDFIVEAQHPDFGGWRYRPQFESDTSVSGWQLMALKSGEMAGLKVPPEAYAGVRKWLDSVSDGEQPGQFSYHPSRGPTAAMTAEGLLMRQYLGAKRNDRELMAGADFLRSHLPDPGQRDAYYWYYATQVMFHMQGEHWAEWNGSLRDLLESSQIKDGDAGGSWDPAMPTPDKWSKGGGRHYVTCMHLLMLEVYYRHLPLYLELEK